MVETVSRYEGKVPSLVRAQLKSTDKETSVRYTSHELRFPHLQSQNVRSPVHEDFNSFLVSSAAQIQEKFSDVAKISTTIQSHRFGPEDGSLQRSEEKYDKRLPVIKNEPATHLDKKLTVSEITPRLLEILGPASTAQLPKIQHTTDKGYGARIATDPLIALATSTDLDKVSIGLIGSVQAHSRRHDGEHDAHDLSRSNQKSKMVLKADVASRSEHVNLLRREEIQVLRDVKEKFQQQLNAQHPHISIPIEHPEGIVDIHMRFDRKAVSHDGVKGAVRVMFSGSNPQVISLFAQHRQEFMDIIINEGYTIDPARIQFNGPIMTKT